MLWRPYCVKGVASEAAQGPFTLVADSTVQPTSSPGQDRRTAGAMVNGGGGMGQSDNVPTCAALARGWRLMLVVKLQKRLLVTWELTAAPRMVPKVGSSPSSRIPSGISSNWLLAIVTFVPLTANPSGRIPGAVPWQRLFLTTLLSPLTKAMCHWLSRRVFPSMMRGWRMPNTGG